MILTWHASGVRMYREKGEELKYKSVGRKKFHQRTEKLISRLNLILLENHRGMFYQIQFKNNSSDIGEDLQQKFSNISKFLTTNIGQTYPSDPNLILSIFGVNVFSS